MPNPIINRRIIELSSGLYIMRDSDAIAYINAIGDVPTISNFRRAVDQLVISHKSNSLWTKLKWALIAPPTMGTTSALTDLVSASASTGALQGNTKFGGTYPCGYFLDPLYETRFKTGRTIQSTANSTAFTTSQLAKKDVTKPVFMRVDTGATAFLQFGEFEGANVAIGKIFNTTTGISTANASAIGRYWINRNSSTYFELVKNNTILATVATAHTGTVPAFEVYMGAQNSSGVISAYGDGLYSHLANYDGLTTAERSIADGIWATFMSTIGRLNPTVQIIFDGNSLSIYAGTGGGDPSHRYVKNTLYRLAEINKYPLALNYAIGGQTTTEMSADFSTQITPKLNSALTKNIYIPWEITNDFTSVGGGVASTAVNNYWTLCDTARTAGFTVIAVPVIARTYVGNGAGLSETAYNLGMDEINTLIRANWSAHADYLCDITNVNLWVNRANYANDAAYNTAISNIVNNATYYLDGVHLKNTGYDIVGLTMYNTLMNIV